MLEKEIYADPAVAAIELQFEKAGLINNFLPALEQAVKQESVTNTPSSDKDKIIKEVIHFLLDALWVALINPTCQLKHQIFKGIADNEECYFKKEAIWHYRMDGSEHSGLDH